jgi:hypothetical protein
MSTLQEAVQFLLDGGFMTILKGKYIVTNKFYKEMTGINQGLTMLVGNIPAVVEPTVPKKVLWSELYTQFILESKVPARGMSGRGEAYTMNLYSDDGMKAFKKAIESEGIQYPLLVEATQLYYTSSIGMKVAIGRFIGEGMWRTYYQELLEMKQSGQPIKPNKDEPYSRYRAG